MKKFPKGVMVERELNVQDMGFKNLKEELYHLKDLHVEVCKLKNVDLQCLEVFYGFYSSFKNVSLGGNMFNKLDFRSYTDSFTKCTLTGLNLRYGTIVNDSFTKGSIDSTNFYKSDFLETDFKKTELFKLKFKHCSFTNVSFENTFGYEVEFTDCVFYNCCFRNDKDDDGELEAVFKNCSFTEVSFKGKLKSLLFDKACKFVDCDVSFYLGIEVETDLDSSCFKKDSDSDLLVINEVYLKERWNNGDE